MPVSTWELKSVPTFRYHYDAEADVLYVSWSEEVPTEGRGIGANAILRANDSGEPLGVTIYDVRRIFDFDPSRELLPQVSTLTALVLSDYARQRS